MTDPYQHSHCFPTDLLWFVRFSLSLSLSLSPYSCCYSIALHTQVAQHLTTVVENNDKKGSKDDNAVGYLYSTFDTAIFSLTVIPIIGWFKLLPTFGGCVVTAAKCTNLDTETGKLSMVVDYTTSRPVKGLSGLGEWIWSIKVPVGAVWKLLPWNKGREATCSVTVRYVDEDFRVVEDITGDLFVYTRPVVPRELDLVPSESS